MKHYQFEKILMDDGWHPLSIISVSEEGIITEISNDPKEKISIEQVKGAAIPAFTNGHSHAFQYAMIGAAEIHPTGTQDDFWSWRENMYRCALTMNPDEVEACATVLYKEMVRHGYGTVVEFHYLHHDKDGKPYHHLAEMGERLLIAAKNAGIRITLVPIFYSTGNFGKSFFERQKRFISPTPDDYLKLLEDTTKIVEEYAHANIGYGPHSLRAVSAEDILFLEKNLGTTQLPFHIHLSEQQQEVERCISYLGKRPVEWMLDNLDINSRFNFIHCTHLTDIETQRLGNSSANVILCPSTEANLGDGIFSLYDFANAGGLWSIGTDSQINLNPLEDIRWLDYAQRLTRHKRNTFDNGADFMFKQIYQGGLQAQGRRKDKYFSIGQPLDAVVYDLNAATIAQSTDMNLLPAIIYTCDSSQILGTMMSGKWSYQKQ